MPVIITPNTGGEDLIIEGDTGYLIPIRSPHLIAEKISILLEHPQRVLEMGAMARQHAVTYTWNKYYQQIIQHLN